MKDGYPETLKELQSELLVHSKLGRGGVGDSGFRLMIGVANLGAFCQHQTHDPVENPIARPHGTPESKISDAGHAIVQILTFCAVCDIDLQQAVNSALDNLRTKDFIRKEPSGGAGVVAGVSVVDTKTSGMVYINKDPATVTPEALMWHQNEILVISHPTSDARLKNFAGIITDHGGIACHAAIVARERNIPCIVGTGNATKVLSDGDFIVMNEPLPGVVNVRTMEEP